MFGHVALVLFLLGYFRFLEQPKYILIPNHQLNNLQSLTGEDCEVAVKKDRLGVVKTLQWRPFSPGFFGLFSIFYQFSSVLYVDF